MSEIKYEAVFGDQLLFNDVSDKAVIVIKNNNSKYVITENESSDCFHLSLCQPDMYIAMRRIIKEPKRWTVADQKAGRLPEVGAHLLTEGNLAEFIGLSNANNNWCFRRLDGEHGIQTANKDWFAPIETPAEKAARLKSEWCAKAAKQLKNLEYTSTLTSIYDALLSGELKAPESTE